LDLFKHTDFYSLKKPTLFDFQNSLPAVPVIVSLELPKACCPRTLEESQDF